MAILTPNALPSDIRFDTANNQIWQVDGGGNEISGTRSTLTSKVGLSISNRSSWQTQETADIASQFQNLTNTSILTLGGIATLNAKTYSARIPVPETFSIVSVSVSAGTAGSGTGSNQFVILNKGSAISSSITITNGVTSYNVVPTNVAGTGPVAVTGTATDNYLQIQVTSVSSTPPKNITFSLRLGR